VVREMLEILQISVEGEEGLEVSILPGPVPVRGTSKAMVLVTNRYRQRVLDLKAAPLLMEPAPKMRLGSVSFRQTSLLPGEVTFGTVDVATDGAAPGHHGVRMTLSYRLGPSETGRDAGEVRAVQAG